jgi:hypothetical protein
VVLEVEDQVEDRGGVQDRGLPVLLVALGAAVVAAVRQVVTRRAGLLAVAREQGIVEQALPEGDLSRVDLDAQRERLDRVVDGRRPRAQQIELRR